MGFNTGILKDPSGNYCCSELGPCTIAGQVGCVQCNGNSDNLCTPTEADFVQLDITTGLATAPGPDPAAGCYPCLVAGGCLDGLGLTGDECEDTTGAAVYINGTTAAECEAVVQCILASGEDNDQCAYESPGGCYCGKGVTNATCAGGSSTSPDTCSVALGPIKGVCAEQIASGLAFPCGDGADIAPNTNTTRLAAGRGIQIFTCAGSNSCTQCL
jgi:hypothetical protein